jgi:hypothetical protein
MDSMTPSQPGWDEPQVSWLAKNRKLVILSGVVLVLMAAAIATALLGRGQSKSTTSNTTRTVSNTNSTKSSGRTTFQRSTIANTSTAPPNAYQPPTTDDLQKAINALPK